MKAGMNVYERAHALNNNYLTADVALLSIL